MTLSTGVRTGVRPSFTEPAPSRTARASGTAPAARPSVRLERPAPARTIARSPAVPVRRTTGRSLAAATGAPLIEGPSGRSTVQLGPSDLPTLARAATPEPAAPSLATPILARSAASVPTLARAAGGGGAGGDSYEEFVDRLRRDLLREREQLGDLLGDQPW